MALKLLSPKFLTRLSNAREDAQLVDEIVASEDPLGVIAESKTMIAKKREKKEKGEKQREKEVHHIAASVLKKDTRSALVRKLPNREGKEDQGQAVSSRVSPGAHSKI